MQERVLSSSIGTQACPLRSGKWRQGWDKRVERQQERIDGAQYKLSGSNAAGLHASSQNPLDASTSDADSRFWIQLSSCPEHHSGHRKQWRMSESISPRRPAAFTNTLDAKGRCAPVPAEPSPLDVRPRAADQPASGPYSSRSSLYDDAPCRDYALIRTRSLSLLRTRSARQSITGPSRRIFQP